MKFDDKLKVSNQYFYFDYQNSKYGYNTSSSRGADTFHPFKTTHTGTYSATSRSASLDMGEDHSYRYVNTNSVPNTNSDTYTYATNSTGGTVDMGTTNTYRYVNASNVYNKGKSDGVTVHSTTYTFAANDTGGTKDLGTSHTYRYVNATNVYNKGKADSSLSTLVIRTDGDGNYTYFETSFIKSIGFTKLNQQATSGSGYGTIWVSTAVPFASGTFTEIGTRVYNSTVTFTSAHLNNYNYVFFGGPAAGVTVKFTFSK